MQSIRDDIKKEHRDIHNADVIIFFLVAQFVIAFQRKKVLLMQVRFEIRVVIYVHLGAACTWYRQKYLLSRPADDVQSLLWQRAR